MPTADGFARRHTRRLADQFRIPTGGLPQGNRENGAVPVDHVLAEDQRNPEPAFLGDRCASALCAGVPASKEGTPAALTDLFFGLVGEAAEDILRHLPEFFLERHAGEQRVNFLFGLRRRSRAKAQRPGSQQRHQQRRLAVPHGTSKSFWLRAFSRSYA